MIDILAKKTYNNNGDVMQFNKKKRGLYITVMISIFLSLFFNIFRYSNFVNNVKQSGFGLISTFKYTLIEKPTMITIDFFSDLVNFWNLREENEELRKQLEFLEHYKNSHEESLKLISELEKLLDVKTELKDYPLVTGTVINRGSDQFNNTFIIDIGSNDGVKEGSAVIVADGLVGKVSSVQSNTSTVTLLTSKEVVNKISIKIDYEGRTVHGVLEYYDDNKSAFVVNLFESGLKINENTKVYSSGLGGVFPKDILIGVVSEFEDSSSEIVTNLFVSPSADFMNFSVVYVIGQSD